MTPGGTLASVSPGRKPLRQVAPSSVVTAKPTFVARALEAASDLEGGDRRSAEREAVGLDLGLVLGAVVSVRVAREAAADELAVARDRIDQVGVHDVGACAAAHRVTASVVCREHQIGSRPSVHRVRGRGRR